MSDQESEEREQELRVDSVRVVRLGHGANCSSIGSVVDTLFLSAVLGGAVLAAVLAAMKKEPITVIGSREGASATEDPDHDEPSP